VRIKVWDLPIRLFHWAIVVLIALAWWTAETDHMQWHLLIGYVIAGLLVFRLWWGFFGGSTARFAFFVRGPRAVAHYAASLLKRPSEVGPPGHNPMGGWSVIALLAMMIGEVGLGLYAVDVDGVESGPLADRVSFDAGRVAAHWHHLLFNGLLALIAIHLCAIAFYAAFKRDNLIAPMLTGRRRAEDGANALHPASIWWALGGSLLAILIAIVLARGLKV